MVADAPGHRLCSVRLRRCGEPANLGSRRAHELAFACAGRHRDRSRRHRIRPPHRTRDLWRPSLFLGAERRALFSRRENRPPVSRQHQQLPRPPRLSAPPSAPLCVVAHRFAEFLVVGRRAVLRLMSGGNRGNRTRRRTKRRRRPSHGGGACLRIRQRVRRRRGRSSFALLRGNRRRRTALHRGFPRSMGHHRNRRSRSRPHQSRRRQFRCRGVDCSATPEIEAGRPRGGCSSRRSPTRRVAFRDGAPQHAGWIPGQRPNSPRIFLASSEGYVGRGRLPGVLDPVGGATGRHRPRQFPPRAFAARDRCAHIRRDDLLLSARAR